MNSEKILIFLILISLIVNVICFKFMEGLKEQKTDSYNRGVKLCEKLRSPTKY